MVEKEVHAMDTQFTVNNPNKVVERLADPANDFYSVDAANEIPDLSGLISEFLKVCPDPTDGQIHTLADALGVDHADLERQMFADLAQFQRGEVPDVDRSIIESMVKRVLAYTTDEAVLQGDVPDDMIPNDDLYMNDGATGPETELKERLYQNLLIHDGGAIPPNPAKVSAASDPKRQKLEKELEEARKEMQALNKRRLVDIDSYGPNHKATQETSKKLKEITEKVRKLRAELGV